MNKWLIRAILLVPAILILPLLDTQIPIAYHQAREVAGYFQTIAIVRDGAGSLFYSTPAESRASIHLHGLLSAPLVALGYHEGGRLISFLCAIITTVIVKEIGSLLWSKQVGYLSAAILWTLPLYIRQSYSYMPEALSILLTTTAVYLTVYLVIRDEQIKTIYPLLLAVLFIAPFTHTWEASVLLPVFGVFLYMGKYRKGISSVLATISGLLLNLFLTSFQPSSADGYRSHTIFHTGPEVIFRPNFWLSNFTLTTPTDIIRFLDNTFISLVLPISVIIALSWAYLLCRDRSLQRIVLTLWTLAGLSIPFGLAAGYVRHFWYFQWGLLVPLAISTALGVNVIIERGSSYSNHLSAETVVQTVIVLAIVFSSIYIPVYEYGMLRGSDVPVLQNRGSLEQDSIDNVPVSNLQAAAKDIDESNVSEAKDVCLHGQWLRNGDDSYEQNLHIGHLLIYSNVHAQGIFISNPNGPRVVPENKSVPRDCPIIVNHSAMLSQQ